MDVVTLRLIDSENHRMRQRLLTLSTDSAIINSPGLLVCSSVSLRNVDLIAAGINTCSRIVGVLVSITSSCFDCVVTLGTTKTDQDGILSTRLIGVPNVTKHKIIMGQTT